MKNIQNWLNSRGLLLLSSNTEDIKHLGTALRNMSLFLNRMLSTNGRLLQHIRYLIAHHVADLHFRLDGFNNEDKQLILQQVDLLTRCGLLVNTSHHNDSIHASILDNRTAHSFLTGRYLELALAQSLAETLYQIRKLYFVDLKYEICCNAVVQSWDGSIHEYDALLWLRFQEKDMVYLLEAKSGAFTEDIVATRHQLLSLPAERYFIITTTQQSSEVRERLNGINIVPLTDLPRILCSNLLQAFAWK